MRIPQGFIDCAGRTARRSLPSEIRRVLTRGCLRLAVAVLVAIPAWSQKTPEDLGNKSIEDLMNIEVTSVSKKEQKLSRTRPIRLEELTTVLNRYALVVPTEAEV